MGDDLDLDVIEARERDATPGPWVECGHDRGVCQCRMVRDDNCTVALAVANTDENYTLGEGWLAERAKRNATFIAHARTDIPALVAEVRRLREERDAERAAVGRMQDHVRAELVRHLRSSGVPYADSIDGGASDGDEYDFTGAEISQAMSMLEEHVREEGRRAGLEEAAATARRLVSEYLRRHGGGGYYSLALHDLVSAIESSGGAP